MKRSVPFLLLRLLCALSLRAGSVFGQEVAVDNFSGVGARAMGMGGAYVAVAEDFSATYWNPAGLAQIKRAEMYGSILYSEEKIDALLFGQRSPAGIADTRFGSLGLVYPYPVHRGSLAFAAGFNRTKEFDSKKRIEGYDAGVGFHRSAVGEDEGGLGGYTVAAAVDISPSISIGAALNVWRGEDAFSQRKTLRDIKDVHADTVSLSERLRFSDRYSATNVRFGAMIRASEGVRLGATVSTPVVYKVRSSGQDAFEDIFDGLKEDYGGPADFSGTYRISLPFEFGVGCSGSFSGVLLAGGIHYAQWGQTEYRELPVFKDEFGQEFEMVRVADLDGDGRPDFDKVYKSTVSYYVGGEYAFPYLAIDLRAGFYRDPIPFVGPRAVGDPSIAMVDDRNFLTMGIGLAVERVLRIDVAWLRGTWRQVEGDLEERGRKTRVFGSLNYRF